MDIHELTSLSRDCQLAEEAFQKNEFSECLAILDSVLPRVLDTKMSGHERPLRSWFFHDQSTKVKQVIRNLVVGRVVPNVARDRLFDILLRSFRKHWADHSYGHRLQDVGINQSIVGLALAVGREAELLDTLREQQRQHAVSVNYSVVDLFLLEFQLLDQSGRIEEADAQLDATISTLANSYDCVFEQHVARYYMGEGKYRQACKVLNVGVDRLLEKYQDQNVRRFSIPEAPSVHAFLELVELLDDKELAHRYAELMAQSNHRNF